MVLGRIRSTDYSSSTFSPSSRTSIRTTSTCSAATSSSTTSDVPSATATLSYDYFSLQSQPFLLEFECLAASLSLAFSSQRFSPFISILHYSSLVASPSCSSLALRLPRLEPCLQPPVDFIRSLLFISPSTSKRYHLLLSNFTLVNFILPSLKLIRLARIPLFTITIKLQTEEANYHPSTSNWMAMVRTGMVGMQEDQEEEEERLKDYLQSFMGMERSEETT